MNNKTLGSLLVAIATFVSLPSAQLNAQSASGSAVQEPKLVSQSAPAYTYSLRRDEIVGRVVVSFRVTPAGNVTDAAIVSSTQKRLEKPTLVALAAWKFAPATKTGTPVAYRMLQTVIFSLPGKSG
jgi:protein TonB